VRGRRGDLFAAVPGERFDVIVSNPPYVPAGDDDLPTRGPERAWEAGRDGRALVDRICSQAPGHLREGGVLLLVHSTVCGEEATLERLEAAGLEADVAARHPGPLGRLLSERATMLEERGLLAPGRRAEEVLVIRGRAPALA
jgi:release factor glutamine methyltransferase